MSAQINKSSRSTAIIEAFDQPLQTPPSTPHHDPQNSPKANIRPSHERRTPPDRGIILLSAKERIGPKIWALYGKVEAPVILRDDRFIEPGLNDFYRDKQGRAFLLIPYADESDPNRGAIADNAYRRAIALGITERPEVFLSCLYHYQLPEYRCIAIHQDAADDIIEEDKCLVMLGYETARLAEQLQGAELTIDADKKIKPVNVLNVNAPSNNLLFALNTLYIHHNYSHEALGSLLLD